LKVAALDLADKLIPMKKIGLVAICTILAVAVSLAAAGCSSKSGQSLTRPNVVVIVIDTLRADMVGAFGSIDGLTPHIDQLAAESVVFSQTYASSSWTLPSCASLFTGLFAPSHGVEKSLQTVGKVLAQDALPQEHSTLAERLHKLGYYTIGLVTNQHLQPEFGFSQGFDEYEIRPWQRGSWLTGQVSRSIRAWRKRAPFFLYLHYIDPHEPYDIHRTTPLDLNDEKILEQALEQSGQGNIAVEQSQVTKKNPRFYVRKALYKGEVKYVDQQVGKALKTLSLSDEDLLIITSDHGEGFLEHGRLGHGNTLYGEAVRVPLLIRFPKKRFGGRVVEQPVSLVDILPTVMGTCGFGAPKDLDGISLQEAMNTESFPERPVYTDLHRPPQNKHSLIAGFWKLNVDLINKKIELYDLEADPGETRNLAEVNGPVAAELQKRLKAHINQAPVHPVTSATSGPQSKEQLDTLRTMGYL
jgi:arylsulfatase A-like enzyme